MNTVFHRFNTARCGPAPRLLSWVFAGLAWACALQAQAQPSQVPLTSRSAPPPAPNVMVTIDNSGSMTFDAMPEGWINLNGGWLYLVDSNAGGFPNNPRRTGGGNSQTGTVVSIKGDTSVVYQMQYRSPQVNSIWYNPAITYLPWVSSDGVTRMGNSDPAKAPWHPTDPTATFDLVTSPQSISNRWFTAAGSLSKKAATKNFYPGLYYILGAGADPTNTASYTEVDINSGTEFGPYDTRTDCKSLASGKCTQAEERQNFANWFTYYRAREAFAKGAVSETLANFVGRIRAGWGLINPPSNTSVVQQEVKLIDSAGLTTMLTGIQGYVSDGGTPLRRALAAVGEYFSKTDSSNPWADTPGDPNSKFLACRRSVNVLMTDGYYNDQNYSGPGNVDGADGPEKILNPATNTTFQYAPVTPFKDSYSDTLSDVAMQYFIKDLQPGIDNRIPVTTTDMAYWQHLTEYTVGIGVFGTLLPPNPTAADKQAAIAAIKAGTKSWPDGTTNQIDDLFHAAVNTGGDFYTVKDPKALASSLQEAFYGAVSPPVSEGGVAVNGNALITGSLKLVPWYSTPAWYGELNAYALDATGKFSSTPTWSASKGLPAAADRTLYTWDSTSGPIPFNDQNATLVAEVGSKALINFIRGDRSQEGVGQTYRQRVRLLGDIVDSQPVYVKGLVDLNYDPLDASYRSYVDAKKARQSSVVFVGANDGMLHAFSGEDGKELYGYLPRTGLKNLAKLADKGYGTSNNYHQFFVDGPMVEADALIATRRNATPAWANLVVGSMGVGGTSIYALHVDTTDPTVLDANTLLWEKSASDIANLGYVVSPMAVGKLKGKAGWVALVGNGAFSKSGVASLLVVDLATGVLQQDELVLDSAGGNGLMGVTALLDSKTQEIVGAYAGDLQGNVWRIDFGATGLAAIGFGGKPLFTAKASGAGQPITVAPQWVKAPSGPGRVVVFGTGRLLTSADSGSTQQQTLYGVLDPTLDGVSSVAATSPFGAVTDGRSLLSPRTPSAKPMTNPATGVSTSYYEITGSPMDWTKQKGWYMDMPFPTGAESTDGKQRETYPVVILQSAFAFFQTVVPPAAGSDCGTASGGGYNYLLNVGTGLPSTTPTFDTNGDGKVNDQDLVNVGGMSTGADGADKLVTDGSASAGGSPGGSGGGTCPDGKVAVRDESSIGSQLICVDKPPVGGGVVKDRIWRRIVNPPL
jgi:type IV pilus assembly protein PilY1